MRSIEEIREGEKKKRGRERDTSSISLEKSQTKRGQWSKRLEERERREEQRRRRGEKIRKKRSLVAKKRERKRERERHPPYSQKKRKKKRNCSFAKEDKSHI